MGDIFGATEEGNEEEVIRLLDAEPTLLEREDDDGNRPLLLAAWYGQLGVTRLLIARGANINATGVHGGTALHSAASITGIDYYDIVALLLREGAHANTRNDHGITPLMLACLNRRLGVMKLLLQHMGGQGLEDREAEHGWTALHYAGCWGYEEVVRFLLFAGADPTITDNRGRTPRALAEEEHPSSIMAEGRARCMPVFEWWEGELERRALLSRATCLHKAYMTQRDQPTSQVPTYLEARVAAGHAVPVVEVVSPQSERRITRSMVRTAEASSKRKAAGEAQGAEAGEEETRHAVLEYVVKGLDEALLTELLEGFHCGK